MSFRLRQDDPRPTCRPADEPLHARPRHPIRWLPRHGEPYCLIDLISQTLVRSLAYLPLYTAIVVTVTLLVILFGWL